MIPSQKYLLVAVTTAFLALALVVSSACAQGSPKVLVIRGGTGTGGVNSPNDNQLSDIFSATGNTDWVDFRQLLEVQGFTVEQMIEGNVISTTDCTLEHGTPLNLAGMNLAQYDIIVFGSNNARYDNGGTAHIDAVENYILEGGAALFLSDANWGRSWNDAPDSDQSFLDRFGLIMNQDRSTYVVSAAQGDFVEPSHPILTGGSGVAAFDGEGVSPVRFSSTPAGMKTTKIVTARSGTRDNDGVCTTANGAGSNRATDSDDCALIVVEAGLGRVAGHFDRNTFFSTGGAGTDLSKHDNTQYAINLFAWLSEAGSFSFSTYSSALAGPSGFSEDSDGDRVVNGIEYALGIDGNDPSSGEGVGELPAAQLAGAGAARHLQLDFAIASPPRGDLTLRVQISDNLAKWTTIAEKIGPADWTGPATVTEGAVTSGRQAISVEDTTTVSTVSRRFVRLFVEQTIIP